jgi:hypothetical protein
MAEHGGAHVLGPTRRAQHRDAIGRMLLERRMPLPVEVMDEPGDAQRSSSSPKCRAYARMAASTA